MFRRRRPAPCLFRYCLKSFAGARLSAVTTATSSSAAAAPGTPVFRDGLSWSPAAARLATERAAQHRAAAATLVRVPWRRASVVDPVLHNAADLLALIG
jgi:hypothetical protein